MAMTKAEKAAVDALKVELALRWPRYEMPARLAYPERKGDYGPRPLVIGWWMNAYNGEADQGCTDGMYHSRRSTTKTDTQTAGVFWPTKLDALKAMRIEMSKDYARKLAAVDARIAEAEAAS